MCNWIDTLDADAYGELVHLREYGWSQNIGTLSAQLTAAVVGSSPEDKTVISTLKELQDSLKGEDGNVVSISDGMVKYEEGADEYGFTNDEALSS